MSATANASVVSARLLSDEQLVNELREIAMMLRAKECPDSAAQVMEAAYRIENPNDSASDGP